MKYNIKFSIKNLDNVNSVIIILNNIKKLIYYENKQFFEESVNKQSKEKEIKDFIIEYKKKEEYYDNISNLY